MQTFYYTYGINNHFPFVGGWTEIVANDIIIANNIFKKIHPNIKDPMWLNCSDVYIEEEFKMTSMYKKGNYNKFAHECIIVNEDGTYYTDYSIIKKGLN